MYKITTICKFFYFFVEKSRLNYKDWAFALTIIIILIYYKSYHRYECVIVKCRENYDRTHPLLLPTRDLIAFPDETK